MDSSVRLHEGRSIGVASGPSLIHRFLDIPAFLFSSVGASNVTFDRRPEMGTDVAVLSAVRTPMGRHGGSLAGTRVDDLAAVVIKESVAASGIEPEQVEEVIFGIVNGSGEAMGNIARFAALLAGLPTSAAGVSMNRYCGSGLSAVNALAHEIAFGSARLGIAGGA